MPSLEDALARYVAGVLAAQPSPPRRVEFIATAGVFLSSGVTGVFAILGILAWIGLVACLARAGFGPGAAILAAMAALFTFGPLNRARQLRDLLQKGKRSTATVDSVAYFPKGTNRTFASMENGMSVGTFHTADQEDVPFEFDQPWALDVREGTKIDVLISGGGLDQRFVFGLASDSPPVADRSVTDGFEITFPDRIAAGAWQVIVFFVSFGSSRLIDSTIFAGGIPIGRAAMVTAGAAAAGAGLWIIARRHRPAPRQLVTMYLLYTGLLLLSGAYAISQRHSAVSRGSLVLIGLLGAGALALGFWARPRAPADEQTTADESQG